MSKLTAMQELRNHVKDMINNGGDDDLMCVMGLINDKFLEKEKQQIIEAWNHAELRTPKEMKHINNAETYYNEKFNNK